jgi:electron transport complex protein RnfE
VGRAALDGLMIGLGFTLVLVVLGGMRELVGNGTLLSQAHLMFGDIAKDWTLTLIEDYRGFLVAILPPGAFIGLGLLIAIKNVIDKKLEQRQPQVIKIETPAVTDGA